MELLLEKEAHLILSWHPGCYHIVGSSYTVGPIGRRGPGITNTETSWVIPGIPSALQFHIKFLQTEQADYDTLANAIQKLAETDQIKVDVSKPYDVKGKIGIKKCFQAIDENIKKQNKIITDKFISLCNELNFLGCNTDVIRPPHLITLPEECFDWIIRKDYGSISVCCHKETEFYKILNSYGLLEKYFPKWYRDGNF